MEISVKSEGRCTEIYLQGELDHHAARGLLQRLDSEIDCALPVRLVLDFGGVPFMDSSGIAVVIRARQRMQASGGRLHLRNTGKQPQKVLDAAGVSRLVEME